MNPRLRRRLIALFALVIVGLIGWRVGIELGWWNSKGCVSSREVERNPDGTITRIVSKVCTTG